VTWQAPNGADVAAKVLRRLSGPPVICSTGNPQCLGHFGQRTRVVSNPFAVADLISAIGEVGARVRACDSPLQNEGGPLMEAAARTHGPATIGTSDLGSVHMLVFAGRRYTVTLASHVKNDGMLLELEDESGATVAEVFYSDATGAMTFTTWQPNLPLEAAEWLIAEANVRLPPART
jgi:hypothetical protein